MAELRTLAPAARFIFQGGPAARAAAGKAFGVTLPEDACRANAAGERAALWLGPDEHLLLAPAGDADNDRHAARIRARGHPAFAGGCRASARSRCN